MPDRGLATPDKSPKEEKVEAPIQTKCVYLNHNLGAACVLLCATPGTACPTDLQRNNAIVALNTARTIAEIRCDVPDYIPT